MCDLSSASHPWPSLVSRGLTLISSKNSRIGDSSKFLVLIANTIWSSLGPKNSWTESTAISATYCSAKQCLWGSTIYVTSFVSKDWLYPKVRTYGYIYIHYLTVAEYLSPCISCLSYSPTDAMASICIRPGRRQRAPYPSFCPHLCSFSVAPFSITVA